MFPCGLQDLLAPWAKTIGTRTWRKRERKCGNYGKIVGQLWFVTSYTEISNNHLQLWPFTSYNY
jgi:hypothetical protein